MALRLARLWASIVAAFIVAATILGCGGDPAPVQPLNGQPPDQQSQAPQQAQEDVAPPEEREVVITSADVGEHLEETSFESGLPFWLAASEDPLIAALPARAKASSGILFPPSSQSPTGETFWVHVFTDESNAAAIEWIEHLARQPASGAGFIVRHPELFEASFQPPPDVGDAAVSIELLSGHSEGCWRTEVVVFAQQGVLVFLRNAIEITADRSDASASGSGASGPCDDARSALQLTDVDAIARLISERLSSSNPNGE